MVSPCFLDLSAIIYLIRLVVLESFRGEFGHDDRFQLCLDILDLLVDHAEALGTIDQVRHNFAAASETA